MKKIISILLLILASFSFSQNKEIGQNFVETFLKEKNFEKTLTFLDASIKDKITIDFLSKTSSQLDTQLGAYQQIISVTNKDNAFSYYCQFANVSLDFEIKFKEDKILGFFLKPHQEINKNDYKIKSGLIDLKGTLLEAENSAILVIFVHGSGPNDRDETIGPNKPFKDLAESFQKEGIASYRFDKRTRSNPETFTENSTIEDEVLTDVVAVVNHFRNSDKFKNYKIIILGHSLGAFMMPKIANSVALDKAIMMAGNARALQDVIVDQYVYLNSLNPTKEGEAEIAKVKKEVSLLNSGKINTKLKSDELPLGLSAKYWQSLLDYKPLVEVKKVAIPLLVLNGERDYQVTMKEFNLWKKTIKNTNAKCISYPKLNHLFIAGEGKPNPEEYSVKGHVDKKVIQDIIAFCKL